MNAAAVFIGASMFAVFAFFPRFVQTPTSTGYGLGASVAESGMLMLPMLVTMAVTGFLSGPLARWIGFRSQIVLSAALMGGASLSLAFLHGSLFAVAAASGVFGLGLGLIYAAITSVVVQSVPATQTGIASGMNANLRTVGSAVGAAVMTALVTGAIAPDGLPAESGYTEGFATAGILALAAGVVTLVAVGIMRSARRTAEAETAAAVEAELLVEAEAEAEALELVPAGAGEREAVPSGATEGESRLSMLRDPALREAALQEAEEMAQLAAKVEAELAAEGAGHGRGRETLEVA
jgi:MFS family permease